MKTTRFWMIVALSLAGALQAPGQDLHVCADASFHAPLQELVSLFTERTGFHVDLSLAPSAILVENIRAGIPADLFFPAGGDHMRQLMGLGLVDVALKRNILQIPPPEPIDPDLPADPQYVSAAVLAQAKNRIPAMAFLEFLAADDARAIFARQGFSLP